LIIKDYYPVLQEITRQVKNGVQENRRQLKNPGAKESILFKQTGFSFYMKQPQGRPHAGFILHCGRIDDHGPAMPVI